MLRLLAVLATLALAGCSTSNSTGGGDGPGPTGGTGGVGGAAGSGGTDGTNQDPPWPDWAFHHWVWENESTQESAIALVDDYLARDIPVGAIIIDSPWMTSYNSFVFEPSQYPDPQGMVDYFHSKGVRVFLWMVSAINLDSPLYAEAAEAGYFTTVNERSEDPGIVDWWKGEGSLIDFLNPDAVQWWHERMDAAIALGVDGWKCDGIDPYVVAAPYSPYARRLIDRNEYGYAYYQDAFDYLRANLGDDRIITARPVDNLGSGTDADVWLHAPVEINWAGWVGDQDSDFRGIRDALVNMYLSSKRGYVAHGSDIGGFRTDRDAYGELGRPKDAFIRWTQLGAFGPIMENGGGGEHRPWMFDEETTDIYRTFVNIHYDLIPYMMKYGGIAFAEGESLTTYQSDEDYSYLLGPDVFVAPMLEEGTSRTVTFPDGTWQYWFDRTKTYEGGATETLDIPMTEFPAFIRTNADPLLD